MSDRTGLGDRMKGYENITRFKLMRRTPTIIRLDGKAFHTFTKGMERPFDTILMEAMEQTMKNLCENIQGCVLGYTQSDEITLVLVDYMNVDSCTWFDGNIQKITSVSSSMATLFFNKNFREILNKKRPHLNEGRINLLNSKIDKAMFDSRVFQLPKEEVVNCLIWRQQDATRNSIQMLGQANFSHRELQNKNTSNIQDMLVLERNINWNNLETKCKRGSCSIKENYVINQGTDKEAKRSRWIIDEQIPIFTQERSYIEKLILI